jgi:hypothetical protein
MNQGYAHLIVALALAVGPHAVMSASSVPAHNAEVDILVDGLAQPRYAHHGRWYVEALKGRGYAIRLQNPHPVRVAVALSVDGLNTIDARQTTAAEARKWVLGPYETVVISGWQTSRTEARRFEFTTEERSYGHALGKTANLGVITAVFFRERVPAVVSGKSSDDAGRLGQEPRSPEPARQEAAAAASRSNEADDYAATGMGRRTNHQVTQVWLDLEDTPAQTVNIRYEFRPQLVRLGILSPSSVADPLQRRERARGFEAGFSPEVPHRP